jgi:hypothetical protein
MARNGRTGMIALACFQSGHHVYVGHTLRSTVSLFHLQGTLIWCPMLGSNVLRFVDLRSSG